MFLANLGPHLIVLSAYFSFYTQVPKAEMLKMLRKLKETFNLIRINNRKI